MNASRPSQPSGAVRRVDSVLLTELLRRPLADLDGHRLGRVIDVVADQAGPQDPVITAIVAGIDDRQVFVPIMSLTVFQEAVVTASIPDVDRRVEYRPHQLLLVAEVLGCQLIDVRIARLVRVRDVEVMRQDGNWVVAGVEVDWGRWWQHQAGPVNHRRARRHWTAFEPLACIEDGPIVGRPLPAGSGKRPADRGSVRWRCAVVDGSGADDLCAGAAPGHDRPFTCRPASDEALRAATLGLALPESSASQQGQGRVVRA